LRVAEGGHRLVRTTLRVLARNRPAVEAKRFADGGSACDEIVARRSTSETTTIRCCADPGSAVVGPFPNAIEQADRVTVT
jgi:hypothetical protein